VLPHFQSILQGGRLGFHNIYPIQTASYANNLVYRDDYGWKVPSLPARVIRELGYHEPAAQRVLPQLARQALFLSDGHLQQRVRRYDQQAQDASTERVHE